MANMKTLARVQQELAAGQFNFSRHAFRRAVERNISDQEIREAGAQADLTKIITLYEPDPEEWTDSRVRR